MSVVENTKEQLLSSGSWSVDPAHSTVEFRVKHMLIQTVKGRFRDFDGAIVAGDEPSLSGSIRVASLETLHEQRDAHLRFTIMSSRCTHVGCPTQPNGPLFLQQRKAERTASGEVGLVPSQPSGFGCPCHGSQFDNEGNRTAGPAARALDRHQFSIRNGHLWLGDLYSVSRVQGSGADARIHAFALRDPGQPVTGPESLLYPFKPGS